MSAVDFLPRSDTALYWLGAAGFMLNARGAVLLLDPLLLTLPAADTAVVDVAAANTPAKSEIGFEMLIEWPIEAAAVPRADAVLYTHTDDDHLGPETARALMKIDPLFIGTPYCKGRLAELGAPAPRCLAGKIGDVIETGGVKIEFLPADHSWQAPDPEKYGRVFEPGDCCGYKITTADGVFVFPGDTRLMKAHLEISGVTVLGLDVSQDSYHLGVQGAAALANHLDTALLVPCHYGAFYAPGNPAQNGDPKDVLDRVKNAASRARILAPGQPLVLRNGREV
jgi:L-ascorbate metabolism protein UlaG (beta-lactamase superfamily)